MTYNNPHVGDLLVLTGFDDTHYLMEILEVIGTGVLASYVLPRDKTFSDKSFSYDLCQLNPYIKEIHRVK